MNTSIKGDNYSQAGLPSRRSEEKQDGGYVPRHNPRMEEEYEPISNPVDGLYSPEQIENFGNDLRRKSVTY